MCQSRRTTRRSLTAKAGEVAIVMTNPKTSGKQHGVGIIGTDSDVRGITVAPGGRVSSHRKAGMRGRLEVR